MTNIVQYAVVLNSQSRVRAADSLAREWAIAHAGPAHRSHASRDLGGSDQFREWNDDQLTIRIAKLTTESFKQMNLYSVNYELSDDSEPYTAYVMTYTSTATEQAGGYCIAVATAPEALAEAHLPWNEGAGPAALEKLIETVKTDRSRPPNSARGAGTVTGVDDLFTIHDTAVVLTADGQADIEFEELADMHSDWAGVVSIDASEQLVLGRALHHDQLPQWMWAKIALFSRYADSEGKRLRMAESELEQAMAFVDAERDRIANEVAGRNAIALMQVLESVSIQLSMPPVTDAKDAAETLTESLTASTSEGDGITASDHVAAQQRIYTLEDQLGEAEQRIAELEERLAQYESYVDEDSPVEDQADEPKPENILDINRHAAVLDAITNPGRFPRLRFLTHCEKRLEDYGRPRPTGMEIVSALESINKLASAWYNTPTRNIGMWDNYFVDLSGWKHADDESEFTMSRFGKKRSFSDQENGRMVEITRHLTYQGSSGGLQIYFDKDDITDTFIVGYIGEHLPYATSPS